jgi:hypothetical protein
VTDLAPTLADFARPALEPLPPDTPLARRREVLGLAVMVWNALILDRNGGTHLQEIQDQLRRLPEPGATILTQLTQELAARREARHPDDLRLVVRWELTEVAPGQLSLEVEGGPAAR